MPESALSFVTVTQLAEFLGLDFQGDADQELSNVASLTSATSQDLCFVQSRSYFPRLLDSHCGAVIVPLDYSEKPLHKSLLYAENPHLSFVQAISLLRPEAVAREAAGIHASAQIAASAQLADDATIGANCVIGEDVVLGQGVTIAAGCVIENGCHIGNGSMLKANVTLCREVTLGQSVILHPGVVIGSDGFGLVFDNGQWIKVPHLGSVQIGSNVEIGANTTVDRGALDDTIIENGVKLDNQIQVAHNVRIGENTAIAGCVGIAGSAIIGKNCKISGGVSVLGHLTIADNVTITAMSMVTKSIPNSGTFSSGTPLMENRLWKRTNARYKSLDKLAKSLSSLEKKKP